jgi:acylphosphatase
MLGEWEVKMEQERLHAIIRGLVQGVFFRDNTQRQAVALGIVGWVRNLSDGTVECVAEGRRAQLDRLVAFWRTNPGTARVHEIAETWGAAAGEFTNFAVDFISD